MGHGCFNAYLHRFKKREDATCFYCQHPVDDVEHTIFRCDRWWRLRSEVESVVNSSLEPESFVALMLQSRAKWRVLSRYVKTLLSAKEEDERSIQKTNIS